MNGTLKVDTSKLASTASSFQSTGNTIRNMTNSMTDTVKSLTGQVWSGDAATKYVAQFNGLQDDINRILNMVNEHVEDLQEMARAYESAESANTSTAGALSADVIV